MEILKDKVRFPHPTSMKFDPLPWVAASNSDAAEVRGIAKVAIKVGEVHQRIRKESMATYSALPKSRAERIGAYLWYLNASAVHLMARAPSATQGENPFVTALHGKVDGVSSAGAISVDEGLSAQVDAARFTLFELMRADELFTGSLPIDHGIIESHYRAGQLYLVWYDVWQDVIHRGLRLHGESALCYDDPTPVLCPLLADYRIKRKGMVGALAVGERWKSVPERGRAVYRGVLARADEKTGCLRFRRVKNLPDAPPFQFFMEMQADYEVSPHLRGVLLPKFGNVSVLEMIRCWQAIAAAIVAAVEPVIESTRAAVKRGEDPELHFSEVVHVFDRLALIGDLEAATGIGRGRIAEIVKAMTFKGDVVHSLWGRPMIDVGDDKLLVVATPYLSGTYLYPLRAWFHEGGADVSEKGYGFERDLFDEFRDSQFTNWPIARWRFYHGANVRCHARNEEVDLLLFTGDRVFVVEAKCFVPGYESHEVARYMAAVGDAVTQVVRKAGNIAASRDRLMEFARDKKIDTQLDLNACPIDPLVVTYHPMGGGFGPSTCPVVDYVSLQKFLENEVPRPLVRIDGVTTKLGSRERLYSSEDDADRVFKEYVRDPPIIAGYKRQIAERPIPLADADGSQSGFVLHYFELAPDPNEQRYFESLSGNDAAGP